MRYSGRIAEVFASRIDGRPLFSFWTHVPEVDRDAEALAQATIVFQREFDLDFVKTMPNGMYAIEDYGTEIDFSDIPSGGVARVVTTPFQGITDWAELRPVDLTSGAHARELRSLRLLRQGLGDVPILFTAFSPITIASKLSQGRIREQIASGGNRDVLHRALGRIAADVARLCAAAIEAGADGVFFAHQDTGRQVFGPDAFAEFVEPYDREALAGARAGRFNVLHLHGEDIRFEEAAGYPVDALNWHVWETPPAIAAARVATPKALVGGIDRRLITANDKSGIETQIAAVLEAAGDAGNVIVTPGCTIRHGFEPDTLHFIRDRLKSASRG